MLLKRLDVTNRQGLVLPLPLEDSSDGFIVKEITGLDPVKATLVSSSFANEDGEQYHSSRREARDIKIKLGLDPDYSTQSVKDLRDQLYQFFMPKTEAKLNFNLFDKFAVSILKEELDLEIEGRIESFDTPIFAQDPEVDILIRCFLPDFVDPDVVTVSGNTVSDLTDTTITYVGTVDTGILVTLYPNSDVFDFTIYHMPPDQTMRTVDFSLDLYANDIVKISSVFGSKYARLTRSNIETPVLYAVSPQSDWLKLQPGDNKLRVYATGASFPYTVEYTTKYGGL